MDKIDTLLKYLPLGTALLIFTGAIYLISLYSFFNIEIYNYITLSEIITSFLKVLILIVILIVIFAFVAMTLPFKNAYLVYENLFFKNKNILTIINFILFIWLNVSIVYLAAYQLGFMEVDFSKTMFTINFMIFTTLIIPAINSNKKSTRLFSLFYVICFVQVVVASKGKLDATKIYNVGRIDVEINFDNEIVTTNDSLIYIGKTENYLFLYDKIEHKTNIYKTENIDNIVEKKIHIK